MSITVPDDRIFTLNDQPLRHDGEYVLYWMISNRRLHWNFSLDRAVALANELNKPLVILEALRCDHRWASDRIHRFVIQGMRENQQFAQSSDCSIHSYVEPSKGAGKGLLQELSRKACAVITDYFPCFFLPRMTQKAAQKIAVRVESIDSNGLYPLQKVEREFTTAASLRRHLQKTIRPHLKQLPQADPLSLRQNKTLTDIGGVEERWPSADFDALLSPDGLRDLPIDHSVRPIRNKGGRSAAVQRKKAFLTSKINRYHSDRNQIENTAASGLSPYLHFGYVSAHELWADIQQQERWSEAKLPEKATGSREGWWNMSPGAEALMDELITWRELGYIFCHRHLDDYDKLSSLPDWALKTIAEHKDDPRPVTYTLQQLEQAQTHDELWNCAQRRSAG